MSSLVKNDDAIIRLLQAKNQKAMEYIYNKYGAALYGVILRIVQSEETAEDVFQEALVKVWKNADRYDGSKGRLFTWLLNICRNLAIDTIRSKKFQQSRKSLPLENSVYNNSKFSSEMATDHIGLKKVINGLEEKYRQVIELVYFQGYTQKEVEETLQIPLGTVKSRIRIAIRELRKLLVPSLIAGLMVLFKYL